MIEPAHVTMNRVLNEPSNGYDDLRIIAKDNRHLSPMERQLLSSAADELEMTSGVLVKMYAELVEARARLVAIAERPWPALQSELGARFHK